MPASDKMEDLKPPKASSAFSAKLKQSDFVEAEYVFNAIKLTNYYTNLLSDPETNELIDLKTSSGSCWRNKQLAHQIPHQDIKLLASSTSKEPSAVELPSRENDSQRSRSAASIKSQSEDEINFIRSQRKLASQFKASLFYLNPVRQTGASQSWSAKKAHKRVGSVGAHQDQASNDAADSPSRVHQCHKVSCLTPIKTARSLRACVCKRQSVG